jgi:hypothetical protein
MAKLFAASRPFTDAERAARRLLEHARAFEPMKDGRIDVEQLVILVGGCTTPFRKPIR